jgi:glucose/arabinose dehydrogenase
MIRRVADRWMLLAVLAAAVAVVRFSTGVNAQSTPSSQPSIPRGADVAKTLPPPDPANAGTRFAKEVGWNGGQPKAADGFAVSLFADKLSSPRGLYVLPNGDVLVSESQGEPSKSPNRVTLLRDSDKDGKADERAELVKNVRQPFGILLLGDQLYVGASNALMRYPYKEGEKTIAAAGTKLLDLPAGLHNNHWTRDVIANADGTKLFISVGSGTNVDEEHVDEKDPRRAAVLEVNPDGTGMRVYASGLRNPVSLALNPQTKAIWTVVNERDMLGDDLVPDYLTSVREGAFYGWPYSYYGQHVDPRKKGEHPELVAKAIPPDFALGSHVAPLGLVFYQGSMFPERYREGAFVTLHGSWNRKSFAGYKVVFVPFQNGEPSGAAEDVLTGFIKNESTNEVFGRPVGVEQLSDGSLIVADDGGNCVWRISAAR